MQNQPNSQQFYDTIARYYDAENEDFTEDLALYASLAEETREIDGPILDLGCGTGRVSFHLAMEGHKVVGLDYSVSMLNRGRRKLKNRIDLQDLVTFLEGSALNYPFPEKYRLVIIPYNTLMNFQTPADQQALLGKVSEILEEDGLLVIDLPNAGEAFATIDDGAVTFERSFIEPESGHLVMQQSVSTMNRTQQLQYVTWIYDEIGEGNVLQRTAAPLTLRYVFPLEMDLLLQINGMRRVERYGDYDSSSFEDGCPRMIVVAQKL